jgi:P27 family predicted phage terminase small subunit
MKGSKGKPDVIKIAQGTFQKCRAKKNPPKASGVPKCPFNVTSIAGRKWKEVTAALKRLGLIDSADGTHIEGLCRQYQLAKQADRMIDKDGLCIEGSMGTTIKNPACTVSDAAWGKVRSYCNDLGLNHLSRQRMESNATQTEDDIESKYLA